MSYQRWRKYAEKNGRKPGEVMELLLTYAVGAIILLLICFIGRWLKKQDRPLWVDFLYASAWMFVVPLFILLLWSKE